MIENLARKLDSAMQSDKSVAALVLLTSSQDTNAPKPKHFPELFHQFSNFETSKASMQNLLSRHAQDRGDFIANIKQLTVFHSCLLEASHNINRNVALALHETPASSPLKLNGFWPEGLSHE